MNPLQLPQFIPWFTLEALVVGVGIFLLMVEAFFKFPKRDIGWSAVFGLLLIFVASFFCGNWGMEDHPSFYRVDEFSIFFKRFMLIATILTIVLAMEYAPFYKRFIPSSTPEAGLGELFILPIFTCAGLMWMVSAVDFVMIFVSLELVTISFYVMVASMRRNTGSLEAGVKYLILGALSTGFLVFGIAWIAGISGTTDLANLAIVFHNSPGSINPAMITPLLFGLGLVLVGLGFKIAAFPFQFWVPDVYQGAPTPVTAYLSIASKAAGFMVLIRVVYPFLQLEATAAKTIGVLTVLAAATLLYGNLAAIPQNNLKRLLAYSSVAHAGYLLVGMASMGTMGRASFSLVAVCFYLAGYLIMTFLAFIVLQHITVAGGNDEISDFNGLAYRSPILAGGMLVSMLSLAGLPFTVGFLGKFFIFEAAYNAHQYWLMAFGAVTVACGFYYYLKVVRVMFWQSAPAGAPTLVVSNLSRFVILLLSVAIFFFGVYPAPLLSLFRF
ncbi:NADH-quinone oxidoreductase subunit N [soil metagenome]